ncbi:MAG: 1-deoxy-D-xylulose-5-phosphate reductoisomerase, partial [Eubacterium sp.]|nr:1-deoxy-D-xylulose-5-phosphate reductoisomerase [Eubacterium sp.]
MKNITILGSTGSIGTQTLDIIRRHRADFSLYALVAGTNVKLMAEQVKEFQPKLVVMKDEERAEELKALLSKQDINSAQVIYGMEGYLEAVSAEEVNLVVAAMVGMIGIRPVIKAIESGKDIAFANKETLVCAGHIIMPLVKKHGVNFLPVDS